ncbi:DegV family protein [Nocardioides sp. Kera G14]|uniref:DegV family protein n=1 Tax=Nocardioides sp. Kera G14 TaxID=2884264 RepID=UPI001D1111B6|nr:DegV family protein [Nocardioides sp. Kera G14]UDY24808.1 DegV family protein [Nocardioides sp. Kera G14]
MASRVVVVTDSTAVLPAELAAAAGIEVVALPVVIAGETHCDGEPGTAPADIVAALMGKKDVSTSRPSPASLLELYSRLADDGASAVLAVHVTGEMSGTVESARLAARTSPIPVVTVDTRAVGPCLGLAALAGVHALAAGASADAAAEAVMARANATTSYFYVDTLEFLRRGGRVGAASALLGSALAVKPLLAIDDGRVVVKEKVRTSTRALARLEELALEAAGEGAAEVVVAHLAAPERAEALADSLSTRLGEQLAVPVRVAELGAALGAHVGPGMVAAVVAPALA